MSKVINNIAAFGKEHKAGILFGCGIAGSISSVIMAISATFRARDAIEAAELEMDFDYLVERSKWQRFKDRFAISWKYYIPTFAMEGASLGCLFAADNERVNKITALSALYSLAEEVKQDYKEAVVNEIGEKKEALIQSACDQKKATEVALKQTSMIETGYGNDICYDPWSERIFMCGITAIKSVVNTLNDELFCGIGMTVSLNDLYSGLNLPMNKMGNYLGWETERGSIQLSDESVTIPIDGVLKSVYVLDFVRGHGPYAFSGKRGD